MDYTYRQRHGEAIYRFKSLPSRKRGPALATAGDGMLPSDFFRRNFVLSFQEDAIGIRLPPPLLPIFNAGAAYPPTSAGIGIGRSAPLTPLRNATFSANMNVRGM
jgi:hypothetical protein